MNFGPTIIIDKNFIQAESNSTPRLSRLAKHGVQFVLTDTLIFELCSDSRIRNLWSIVQRKLFPFAGQLQVWRHTSELLRIEASSVAPISTPLDTDCTERLRYQIRKQSMYQPEDMTGIIEATRQEREVATVEQIPIMARSLGRRLNASSNLARPLTTAELNKLSLDFCSSNSMIYWAIKACFGNESSEAYIPNAVERVDRNWFSYHHARAMLALAGVFLSKYGLRETPGKKLANTLHDLDLLVLLHYATAIASDETAGDLSTARKLLYGETRRQITSRSLLEQGPAASKIGVAAYYNWINGGRRHGNELSDWLKAESTLERRFIEKLAGA